MVRDAAHACHAVIGIAALSNCAVQLAPRDRAIGWSASGLTAALSTLFSGTEQRQARETDDPVLRMQGIYRWLRPGFAAGADPSAETKRAALVRVFDWLHQGMSTAIGEIEPQGLATAEDLASPTQEVIDRLRHLSKEFASRRRKRWPETGTTATEPWAWTQRPVPLPWTTMSSISKPNMRPMRRSTIRGGCWFARSEHSSWRACWMPVGS